MDSSVEINLRDFGSFSFVYTVAEKQHIENIFQIMLDNLVQNS
jgi:hypothetical protein